VKNILWIPPLQIRSCVVTPTTFFHIRNKNHTFFQLIINQVILLKTLMYQKKKLTLVSDHGNVGIRHKLNKVTGVDKSVSKVNL